MEKEGSMEKAFLSLQLIYEKEKNAITEEKRAIAEERGLLEREKKVWGKTKIHLEKVQLSSPVRLNVGGQVFCTSLSNLTKDDDSMFAGMFSGRWDLRKDVNECIFIDRNPKAFGYVLEYLRGEEMRFDLMSEEVLVQLDRDAEFYSVDGLKRQLDESLIAVAARRLIPRRVIALRSKGESSREGKLHNVIDPLIRNASVRDKRLDETDFSHAVLEDFTFQNTKLSGVLFAQAELRRVTFENVDLHRVDFTGATFQETVFTNTKFDGAVFTDVTKDSSTSFRECSFSNCTAGGCSQSGHVFKPEVRDKMLYCAHGDRHDQVPYGGYRRAYVYSFKKNDWHA